MSDSVISVENLGKRYRIRHQQQGGVRYKALRDVLADKTKGVARRLWSAVRHPDFSFSASQHFSVSPVEDFWALKDVSFEVRQGETLGIIGRNGAGKSTLLKILSRITEPTEGRVRIKGRVASLLEVGTGFHPELTGRENIFLNGAILGMRQVEIKQKFDEIVAFAEVEKFLDTPVKHYSSGMYVRLAFAVAAHLEPEILVVDEVLAVGDAAFQKKCLGKMSEVARQERRTVLFVSHNIGAISALCSKALLLQAGAVVGFGKTAPVVAAYLNSYRDGSRHEVSFAANCAKSACLLGAGIYLANDRASNVFKVGDALELSVTYELADNARGMNLAMTLMRNGFPLLASFDTDLSPERQTFRSKGRYQAQLRLPKILKAGRYAVKLEVGLTGIGVIDQQDEALVFEIEELGVDFSQKKDTIEKVYSIT